MMIEKEKESQFNSAKIKDDVVFFLFLQLSFSKGKTLTSSKL